MISNEERVCSSFGGQATIIFSGRVGGDDVVMSATPVEPEEGEAPPPPAADAAPEAPLANP